ncbi:hypothetical protein NC653_022098 [Populus alba x Populus x berolinensis]|uniref:DUF4283 domain-containing protein n=1 Tax=Populus alba x Populus x berolinensis TaxID=444605 RepID=A0AAD6QFG0_9ROSI|nr:hypothetical protein NC653_022098 [Populus alba x Populus x berolinensis]
MQLLTVVRGFHPCAFLGNQLYQQLLQQRRNPLMCLLSNKTSQVSAWWIIILPKILIQAPLILLHLLRNGEIYLYPTATLSQVLNYCISHLLAMIYPDLSPDDLDNNYDVWHLCIVGYVAGKSPGFKALNNIISNSWKCEASLAIHESGWLVYKLKNVDDKLGVLANGPYLIYGRPLIIKAMPE